MRKYFRQAGYFAAILILLPYVVTILLNGRSSLAQDNGTSPYVTVKSDEKNRKISLDEYGIGILAKEIEGDAEEEALKAQAVLIRTSIYKSIQDEGTSTVLTKEYWTRQQMESNWGADHYGEYYEKMKAAWDETRGQVLMYDGRLILTPYHRLSNGKTRSGNEVFGSEEYPYLQSRECPEDVEAKEEMTVSMIQGSDMEVTGTDNAGYVTEVRCGSETVNGEEFRRTYHLASSCFALQDYDGKTRVTAKGIPPTSVICLRYISTAVDMGIPNCFRISSACTLSVGLTRRFMVTDFSMCFTPFTLIVTQMSLQFKRLATFFSR